MAYLVELDVDNFGSLDGSEGSFPVSVVDHNWLGVPYPAVASAVSFEWEPGEVAEAPDVFWYPQMRDWICSKRAYDLLAGMASSDLHLIAEGRLGENPVSVVQVLTVLDVVDRENSIIDRYPSYEILRFPTFFRSASAAVASRIFRVPGSAAMIFMGEIVKQAIDTAGIKGFRFTSVDWSE